MSTSHDSHSSHDDHAHDISKHVKGYLLVGALLLVFTGITVFLSYVDFGSQNANIVVAMAVATFKAGLVAAIFMHLKSERWTIFQFLIFTVIFAVGLFMLTALAYHDPIRIH